ncbi:MAG: FoF1 ATP synthase subunit A [Fastidiosipilaceae bacterium]|jgi:F-type H+-transporting ATPase subunit a|nr:F0F1 ATP synthase subunit A [Clostridiaceae bacterium]
MQSFFSLFLQELWDSIRIGNRNISEGIKEAINLAPIYHIHIGPLDIPITSAMINIVISVIVLAILAAIFTRKMAVRPGKKQAVTELLVDGTLNLCRNQGMSDPQAEKLLPWVLTIGLFISVSNLLAVVRIQPASKSPAFPVALALFTIIFVIVMGIRLVGIKGFLRSLVHPMAGLIPFNLLDYIIKPLSLTFRLFGNVFGSFILLEFVSLVVPLIFPSILGLWFDVGDGIIQGIVFMFLSINYIGEIVHKAAESEELAKERAQRKEAKRRARTKKNRSASMH